jgi:hypothetical protein
MPVTRTEDTAVVAALTVSVRKMSSSIPSWSQIIFTRILQTATDRKILPIATNCKNTERSLHDINLEKVWTKCLEKKKTYNNLIVLEIKRREEGR